MKILQFLVMGRTLFDIRSLEDKVGCLCSFDVRKNDVQVCSMLEKSSARPFQIFQSWLLTNSSICFVDCPNCEHEIDNLKLNSALFESMMARVMAMKALKQIKLDQLNLFDLQKPTRLMKKRSNNFQDFQDSKDSKDSQAVQGNPEETSIVQDLILDNLFKLMNRQEVIVPVNPKM